MHIANPTAKCKKKHAFAGEWVHFQKNIANHLYETHAEKKPTPPGEVGREEEY